MRDAAAAAGYAELVAPVRPNEKHKQVALPMVDYVKLTRDDGLPFDRPGEVDVPGALVPVLCVPEHDYAVYVEPNVWMRHRL